MQKIDLIIDALKLACHETYGLAASDCYSQALAAARELKAIYPQGAKVRPAEFVAAPAEFVAAPAEFVAAATIGANVNFVGTPMIWAEWPTRSDEVTHD